MLGNLKKDLKYIKCTYDGDDNEILHRDHLSSVLDFPNWVNRFWNIPLKG